MYGVLHLLVQQKDSKRKIKDVISNQELFSIDKILDQFPTQYIAQYIVKKVIKKIVGK